MYLRDKMCKDDSQCDKNNYCYLPESSKTSSKTVENTSGKCVNFTTCSQHNREESTKKAHSAAECGPCKTGFTSEILANGQANSFCRQDIFYGEYMDSTTIICISTSILCLVAILTSYLIWRHRSRTWIFSSNFMQNNTIANDVETNNDELTTASAPLEEHSPFVKLAEDKYNNIHNNNRRTVNNEYQTSRVTVLPQWGFVPPRGRRCTAMSNESRTVPHIGNDVPDANIPNERIVSQSQNSIPNNQPTMQFTITGLPEINIEQEDNDRNTTLLQRNTYSSDSDMNSSPESTKKSNGRKKNNVIINQSVNQNISMNVKVVNENE